MLGRRVTHREPASAIVRISWPDHDPQPFPHGTFLEVARAASTRDSMSWPPRSISTQGNAAGWPPATARGRTIALMSEASDKPVHPARRVAIRDRLIESRGLDRDVAERWCDAWEAEAALHGIARDSDYWDAGKIWIDRQCAARKLPPN